MIVKLLTEHHLEFLSLKGGCRGLSECTCTHVKMPHCWKYHALAHRVLTLSLADADSIRTNIGISPLKPLRLGMGSITQCSILLITGIQLACVQYTLVIVYVDLLVFTPIAGTS